MLQRVRPEISQPSPQFHMRKPKRVPDHMREATNDRVHTFHYLTLPLPTSPSISTQFFSLFYSP